MRKRPPKRPETAHRDVHAEITAKIVAAIEAGAGDFQMPWHRPGASFAIPKNALTDKPYRGSNILSLWIDADEKRFERQIWATFRQYQELAARSARAKGGLSLLSTGSGPQRRSLRRGRIGRRQPQAPLRQGRLGLQRRSSREL